jgi:hypothetical protein
VRCCVFGEHHLLIAWAIERVNELLVCFCDGTRDSMLEVLVCSVCCVLACWRAGCWVLAFTVHSHHSSLRFSLLLVACGLGFGGFGGKKLLHAQRR